MTLPQLPPDTALVVHTARLRLDPIVGADANDLFAVLDDIRLHRFIGGTPPTLEQLRACLARWQTRISSDGEKLWLNWVVRRAAPCTAVGYVQATVTGEGAELAYVIGTDWSGQGIATEAVAAVCGWLRALGVVELHAHIHPDHFGSAAVARHVGLVPTGRIRDDGEELWVVRRDSA
jgi:RimJ/RimL family protein N-acetyltransferase